MKVLITGGAGFIGANFVRFVLDERPDWHVTNLDLLTYAGNLESIEDLLDHPRYRFLRLDLADAPALHRDLGDRYDLVVNFAAESHVDRSILNASAFVRTNVLGVQNLLDLARERGWGRMLQVSTDEVYGALGSEGVFTETSPLRPTSPYSASKAAGDLLALAAYATHRQDVVITRCTNNYGPYQFPEKLIPLMILSALNDRPLPVYGDGGNIRDWIHVEDHCRALLLTAENGVSGRTYNIGARSERRNLDVVREILAILGKPDSLITFVKDRPGHDWRYAIDPSRTEDELGWRPERDFRTGLAETVAWYREKATWCQAVLSGEYRSFYDRWYAGRLPSDRTADE